MKISTITGNRKEKQKITKTIQHNIVNNCNHKTEKLETEMKYSLTKEYNTNVNN